MTNTLMAQLSGPGNGGKNDWDQKDMRLAVGFKLLGASRGDIAAGLAKYGKEHSTNSITYLFGRKFTKPVLDADGNQVVKQNSKGKEVKVTEQISDAELFAILDVSSAEEITEYVERCVNEGSADEAAEESPPEDTADQEDVESQEEEEGYDRHDQPEDEAYEDEEDAA